MLILFNPQCYADYLVSPFFHHPDKGCHLETEKIASTQKNSYIQHCLSHNVICSKTGWELHFYLGTTSHFLVTRVCCRCGTLFPSDSSHANFCPKCKLVIQELKKESENLPKL